ncbi:hypothetical protein K461DRAFT_278136 [Myriangium duriaei CBS 260.36]|uniref:Uncharacterized protein n=1 Tax=Myriangium duriaei CBS 260.36 TaxID=1168546 RepID=A0A9P4MHM2_9PEZI|nr:hypothetical protein K461DRAFT_278136 [Myriangium duriaei CBS 260.36]
MERKLKDRLHGHCQKLGPAILEQYQDLERSLTGETQYRDEHKKGSFAFRNATLERAKRLYDLTQTMLPIMGANSRKAAEEEFQKQLATRPYTETHDQFTGRLKIRAAISDENSAATGDVVVIGVKTKNAIEPLEQLCREPNARHRIEALLEFVNC